MRSDALDGISFHFLNASAPLIYFFSSLSPPIPEIFTAKLPLYYFTSIFPLPPFNLFIS